MWYKNKIEICLSKTEFDFGKACLNNVNTHPTELYAQSLKFVANCYSMVFYKKRASCFVRHLVFERLEQLPYLDLCKVQTMGHFFMEMILIDYVTEVYDQMILPSSIM